MQYLWTIIYWSWVFQYVNINVGCGQHYQTLVMRSSITRSELKFRYSMLRWRRFQWERFQLSKKMVVEHLISHKSWDLGVESVVEHHIRLLALCSIFSYPLHVAYSNVSIQHFFMILRQHVGCFRCLQMFRGKQLFQWFCKLFLILVFCEFFRLTWMVFVFRIVTVNMNWTITLWNKFKMKNNPIKLAQKPRIKLVSSYLWSISLDYSPGLFTNSYSFQPQK